MQQNASRKAVKRIKALLCSNFCKMFALLSVMNFLWMRYKQIAPPPFWAVLTPLFYYKGFSYPATEDEKKEIRYRAGSCEEWTSQPLLSIYATRTDVRLMCQKIRGPSFLNQNRTYVPFSSLIIACTFGKVNQKIGCFFNFLGRIVSLYIVV